MTNIELSSNLRAIREDVNSIIAAAQFETSYLLIENLGEATVKSIDELLKDLDGTYNG